ncbi:ribonuclease III [Candidatus Peregrinibacteria bacterium]|nr:ribonuclease III [Candidatus Peregrinibacteria bacterium]
MQSLKSQNNSATSLGALERKIRVKFKNDNLLETAFVHSSYLNEHKDHVKDHNERLEFLGDAVLELVTTEYLYSTFPDRGEGELTSLRAALVKGNHLSQVAEGLQLGKFLFLSHGEEKSGGREKSYILANTLEALIGAIYLDRGFAVAHKFISKFILTNLEDILRKGLHVDAKSKFQEIAQDTLSVTPTYAVLSETGPDHDKVFEVGAYLGEILVAKGKGSSKQKAEQDAAVALLKEKGWN